MSAHVKRKRICRSRSRSAKHPSSSLLDHTKEKAIYGNSTSSSPRNQEVPAEKGGYKRRLREMKTVNYSEQLEEYNEVSSELLESEPMLDDLRLGSTTLPNNENRLRNIIGECNSQIRFLQQLFFDEEKKDEGAIHRRMTGQLFDVIMMDPPWQLSSSNPTRGVAIAYDTLGDAHIRGLPLARLQDSGFLFLWTINAKFSACFQMMLDWGYTFIDDICWVKESVNGKIAKGHGFYLQHSKETCLIGVKGDPWGRVNKGIMEDCIFSKRRGQSQKPNEIYEMIEKFIPDGYYIEIFGRRNNLRNGWVTIGNEL